MSQLAPEQSLRRANLVTLQALRLRPLPAPMTSPPTITIPSAAYAPSTLNGNGYGTCSVPANDNRLTIAHSVLQSGQGYGGQFYSGASVTYGSTKAANVYGVRFQTWAAAFEFATNGSGRFSIRVDGVPVTRATSVTLPGDNGIRRVLVNFGANTKTAYVTNAGVASGGSGYAIGDVITLAGGTGTAGQLVVTNVSGGAVLTAAPVPGAEGAYSAAPANSVAQASTTGSGTGATFTIIYAQRHTTRLNRKIEILFDGGLLFAGLDLAAGETVRPWGVAGPRILFFGDSFTEHNWCDYSGGHYPGTCSERMSLEDWWSSGVGGTGYLKTNGSSGTFRSRLTDITTYNPDLVCIAGAINDFAAYQVAGGPAALQAEVTAFYTALIAGLKPTARLIVFGPWQGSSNQLSVAQAVSATVKAGLLAASGFDPARMTFCDVVAENWIVSDYGNALQSASATGNTENLTTSDQTHPSQAGHDYIGGLMAEWIVRWLSSLTL